MDRSSPARRSVRCSLLVACILAGCARPPAPTKAPNIIIALVDTLRADRLGIDGNPRGLTPFLDSLAEHAIVFHQAYAQAPWTSPSVASLFTSRFQSQHGIVNFASSIAESETTLAEVLHDRGYATAGFLANALVGRHRGFAQGFDTYLTRSQKHDPQYKNPQKPRADTINGLAQDWLKKLPDAGHPFFLYVHYIEPHSPYVPPDVFLDRVATGPIRPSMDMVRKMLVAGDPMAPDAETVRLTEQLYDGEVASVDAGIQDLCAMLARQHLLDDAILVVTADHGEAFNEHGFMGHGGMLYNEVIRVPLLVALPGRPPRVDVFEPVSLVDIAPTVLELIGTPVPQSFEGRSLQEASFRARHPWLAALRQLWDRDSGPRPVFSEKIVPGEETLTDRVHHERAVVMNGRKLILGMRGELEHYDIADDPGEQTPLAKADDDKLVDAMGAFRSRFASTKLEAPPIDPATRERMKALGYVD